MMKYITNIIGIACLTCLGYSAIQMHQQRSSFIKVYGLADIVLESDYADLCIRIKQDGNDIKGTSDKIRDQLLIVARFLKDQGYEENEISEDAIKIKDNYLEYNQNRRYNNDSEPPITRFNFTKLINVRTNKMSKIKTTLSDISELVNKGLFITTTVSYTCSDYDKIRIKLVREATADSLVRANAIAEATNYKITGLRNLSTSRLTILDADNTSGENGHDWSDGEKSFRKRFRMIVEANYNKS